MRKIYKAPALRSAQLLLGVFGDYGDGGGVVDPPSPARVVDRFELRMD